MLYVMTVLLAVFAFLVGAPYAIVVRACSEMVFTAQGKWWERAIAAIIAALSALVVIGCAALLVGFFYGINPKTEDFDPNNWIFESGCKIWLAGGAVLIALLIVGGIINFWVWLTKKSPVPYIPPQDKLAA